MNSADAWVLPLRAGLHAAVGVREQVHLMHDPVSHPVAATPPFCRHVVFWSDRPVPVFDLAVWMGREQAAPRGQLLGIYAFEVRQAGIGLGALWLDGPPQRVGVLDSMAVALPKPDIRWQQIAASCFEHNRMAIPILNLGALFDGALASSY